MSYNIFRRSMTLAVLMAIAPIATGCFEKAIEPDPVEVIEVIKPDPVEVIEVIKPDPVEVIEVIKPDPVVPVEINPVEYYAPANAEDVPKHSIPSGFVTIKSGTNYPETYIDDQGTLNIPTGVPFQEMDKFLRSQGYAPFMWGNDTVSDQMIAVYVKTGLNRFAVITVEGGGTSWMRFWGSSFNLIEPSFAIDVPA